MPKAQKIKDKDKLIPILSIIIGIIVIAWPQIIGIAVGIYLLVTGILKLLGKY
jgi:uncharacterized membrane protein HdeD (DUF308 family)